MEVVMSELSLMQSCSDGKNERVRLAATAVLPGNTNVKLY